MKTLVTKAEYAKRKNRSPSCVSNWIAAGKITKAALDGEGNRARIWVEQADADLANSLDPAQQLSQENPILPQAILGAPETDGAAVDRPTPPGEAAGSTVVQFTPKAGHDRIRNDDLARRAKADADTAEQNAIAARRKNAIEEGRWADVADMQREFARQLSIVVQDVETFLTTTLAREMAEAHGLDWKALSVEVRNSFRKHRTGTADGAKDRREAREAEMLAAE